MANRRGITKYELEWESKAIIRRKEIKIVFSSFYSL